MKTIKQISSLFFLTFILLIFSNTFAYADSFYKNNENNFLFEIKSGIDIEKESLTTFDKNRTITGISNAGNNINISVYQKVSQANNTNEDTYIEVYNYSLVVGPSGYFSQSIDLIVGENLVVISSQKDDIKSSFSTIIKRIKSEIKSELESIIILPISRS